MKPSKTQTTAAGQTALPWSAIAWFAAAAVGQGAFIWMIVVHYGLKTLSGDLAGWNQKPLIKGYVAGDDAGNLMFALHALLAAIITLSGLAQLVPALRRRSPALHRWNGRVFFVLAYAMALGGLWLTWGRHTYLSLVSAVAVSLDGVLILLFATLAWRHAVRRDFAAHRRFALRTFLVVNGVWFLRIGIMAWVLLTGGGLGMNRSLSGPADILLQFGAYLAPITVLEAYFRAQDSASPLTKRLVGGLIFVAAALTAVGVAGAVAFMWGPYMI